MDDRTLLLAELTPAQLWAPRMHALLAGRAPETARPQAGAADGATAPARPRRELELLHRRVPQQQALGLVVAEVDGGLRVAARARHRHHRAQPELVVRDT